MRKTLGIWIPIALLAVFLGGVYLRQWAFLARSIIQARESQKKDIALLTRAHETLEDISTLQMALRVKMFGPAAAAEAVQSAETAAKLAPALPPSIVTAMNRTAVQLVSYRQAGSASHIELEGSYENILKFLTVAGADLPRVEGFEMERADRGRVRLTLSVVPRVA